MIVTAKMLRQNIGNILVWDECIDCGRGVYVKRSGIIDGCEGRNVIICGNYLWLPRLRNARITDKEAT